MYEEENEFGRGSLGRETTPEDTNREMEGQPIRDNVRVAFNPNSSERPVMRKRRRIGDDRTSNAGPTGYGRTTSANSSFYEGSSRPYQNNRRQYPSSYPRQNYSSRQDNFDEFERQYNSSNSRRNYDDGEHVYGSGSTRSTFYNDQPYAADQMPYEGGNNYRRNYDSPRNNYGHGQRPYQPNRGGNYRNNGGYGNRGGYGTPYGGGYGNRNEFDSRKRPDGYGPSKRNNNNNKKKAKKKVQPIKPVKYQEVVDPLEPIRLNKFIANSGVCSRREADELIQAGLITVNGVVVKELGSRITRQDEVYYNGTRIQIESKLYVLLNKPKNCVTTSDDPECRRTVLDYVKNACTERIYPVGRLDRNTTGVLLLTNDGDLAAKLTHPAFMKKKIYHVWLNKDVTPEDMQKIADGIELEDGEIHADALSYVKEDDMKQVGIEIHSGRNRIVRRIFEHLGYKVIKLDRVYFAGLTKKNLARGKWRYLDENEVNSLRMGAFE